MTEQDAVSLCAQHILQDLRPQQHPRSFSDLIYLCEIRGGKPLPDPNMPAWIGGMCYAGEIIISTHCTLDQYREIIPHELVHRLSDMERFEELNYLLPYRSRVRSRFLEAVARSVGKQSR